MNIHRQISDFINNKKFVLNERFKFVRESVFVVGFFELFNKCMAVNVVSGTPVISSFQPQSSGNAGLARTGRAKNDDVFTVFKESHSGKFVSLPFVDAWLEGKIKIFQPLFHEETQGLYLGLNCSFALLAGFFDEYMVKHFYDVEGVLNRSFQIIVKDFKGVFHFEQDKVFPYTLHLVLY